MFNELINNRKKLQTTAYAIVTQSTLYNLAGCSH
jgi:hypothetical protein